MASPLIGGPSARRPPIDYRKQHGKGWRGGEGRPAPAPTPSPGGGVRTPTTLSPEDTTKFPVPAPSPAPGGAPVKNPPMGIMPNPNDPAARMALDNLRARYAGGGQGMRVPPVEIPMPGGVPVRNPDLDYGPGVGAGGVGGMLPGESYQQYQERVKRMKPDRG